MAKKKFTGEWNTQCPYCLGKSVQEDGEWIDRQWYSEFTAHCLACGKSWQQTEVQPAGCPNCGVYHSLSITNVPQTAEEAERIGTKIGWAALWCANCGAFMDQDTGELLKKPSTK